MLFEDAMIEELNRIPEITGKVFPLEAPRLGSDQNPVRAPYVIFVSSEGRRTSSLDGFHASKVADLELNIVGATYPEMKSITRQVIDVVLGFQQRVIGTDGPYIQEVIYEAPNELYESAAKLHRSVLNIEFYFKG